MGGVAITPVLFESNRSGSGQLSKQQKANGSQQIAPVTIVNTQRIYYCAIVLLTCEAKTQEPYGYTHWSQRILTPVILGVIRRRELNNAATPNHGDFTT